MGALAVEPRSLLAGFCLKRGNQSFQERIAVLERRVSDLLNERIINRAENRQLKQVIEKLEQEKRHYHLSIKAVASGKHIPIAGIVAIVARYYKIRPDEIASDHRFGYLIKPRQIAIYLVADITGHSNGIIARSLNRDQTTISYSIERGKKHEQDSEDIRNDIVILRQQIAAAYPTEKGT